MLEDAKEIEIISRARQKNIRDPSRSRTTFERIFSDFLGDKIFSGCQLLDLGPGHHDFGVLAQERGAQVHAIDNDPAVVELGCHKGFSVRLGNLEEISTFQNQEQSYDGVFCKFSLNALWFEDEEELRAHTQSIGNLVKPGGWAWIGPWNGGHDKRPSRLVKRLLRVQLEEFKAMGFWALKLNKNLAKYYGIHGQTANRVLFGLNVCQPQKLKRCRAL